MKVGNDLDKIINYNFSARWGNCHRGGPDLWVMGEVGKGWRGSLWGLSVGLRASPDIALSTLGVKRESFINF